MCTEDVKCTQFKSYCTTYSHDIIINWSQLKDKIFVAYNNVFRLLCNEPRNYINIALVIFVSRGVPTCKMLIRNTVYSFMTCREGPSKHNNVLKTSEKCFFKCYKNVFENVILMLKC